MAKIILLSPNDIADVYIGNKKRDLSTWLETSSAKKLRKVCDYYNEEKTSREVDESIRACFKFTDVNIAFRDLNEVNEKVSKHFSGTVKLVNPELLEYKRGGFFDTHSDTQHGKTHLGNALLIAPQSILKYTGGTLVAGTQRITSVSTKWKLVILPMGTEHRVTKVTSGTRVVIKFQILGLRSKTSRSPRTQRVGRLSFSHRNKRFTNGRKD